MVALSPLDSRYANKLTDVRKIFNEESYYKRMFDCEILWYKYVYETFEDKTLSLKNELKFSLEELKDIEKETNHDVKAVEYLVKRKLGRFSRKQYVHFGLTSEDLVSYALNSEFYEFNSYFYSCLEELEMSILKLIQQNEKLNFIGRTHGQKATLTSVYHQFGTFKERLLEVKVAVGDAKRYRERWEIKFGGTVGDSFSMDTLLKSQNFNISANLLYGRFADKFLVFKRSRKATQTDNFRTICSLLEKYNLAANILLDLVKDIWLYNSLGIIKLEKNQNEVGSSTLSQKVNPIEFENAEGNLKIASNMMTFLINELPISRMQRDLSNNTVMRNLGVTMGHLILGLKSAQSGIKKIKFDREFIGKELKESPEVFMEVVQLMMKLEGNERGYELTKDFSRGKRITYNGLVNFISKNIKDKHNRIYLNKEIKSHLKSLENSSF